MKTLVLLLSTLLLHAETLDIRGKPQPIAVLPAVGTARGSVVFLPGDGGWRGLAVTIGQRVAGWGYTVYGFDTKHYLEAFSEGSAALTAEQMNHDMAVLIDWAHKRGGLPVTVLGWSQGAGMGVLAATGGIPGLDGVVTLGLPKTVVLGWNWKDMFAAAARLRLDEPFMETEPLLHKTSVPVWMIYGTADEYTSGADTDRLFVAANQPKQIVKVPGANHRFDSRADQLNRALEEGLAWVRTAKSR